MLGVGSYNIHFKMTPANVARDLTALLKATRKDVSVWGLNEFGNDERQAVLDSLGGQGWEHFRADAMPGQDSVPIIWDALVWDVETMDTRRLSEPVTAEKGAGGARIPAKYATLVILRHKRSGKRCAFICLHLPATIQSKKKKLRRAVAKRITRQVRIIAAEVRPTVAAVFVVGDMNLDYRKAAVRNAEGLPIRELQKIGMRACWHGRKTPYGTHIAGSRMKRLMRPRGRVIDYVFSTATCLRAVVLRGYLSDHRPVAAFYRV